MPIPKECPICHETYYNLGAHMKACYEKHHGKGVTNSNNTTPNTTIPNNTIPQSSFDEMEKIMSQQLRMIQMQNMMKELSNSNPKTDSFDTAMVLMERMNKMMDTKFEERKVLEESLIKEIGEEVEDPEQRMALKVLEKVFMPRVVSTPSEEEQEDQEEVEDPMRSIKPSQIAVIKNMYKQGTLTKEKAKSYVPNMSDEVFEDMWKKHIEE